MADRLKMRQALVDEYQKRDRTLSLGEAFAREGRHRAVGRRHRRGGSIGFVEASRRVDGTPHPSEQHGSDLATMGRRLERLPGMADRSRTAASAFLRAAALRAFASTMASSNKEDINYSNS